MRKIINIDTWNRKEHFNFFKNFDDPFFGVTVNVDFSTTYRQAKEAQASFFLYSLHKIMQAVNETEAFRYRIEDDELVSYDVIHPTSTVGREDGTFSFSFFEYYRDTKIFVDNAQEVVEKIKETTGLGLETSSDRNDIIHYSSVPWIQFTDMKHAVSFGNNTAIPKISTGKYFTEEQKIMLPVSITVNHAVMDGFHVALFLDKLKECIESE